MLAKRNINTKVEVDSSNLSADMEYCFNNIGPMGKKSGWWYKKTKHIDFSKYQSQQPKYETEYIFTHVFLFKHKEDALAFKIIKGIL